MEEITLIERFRTFRVRYTSGDKVLWALTFSMVLLSIPMLFSSGADLIYDLDKGYFKTQVYKQLFYIVLGLICMSFASRAPITLWGRYYKIFNIVLTALLFAAFIYNFSRKSTGRSLPIPILGGSFQVTELSKLFIVYCSAYLLRKTNASSGYRTSAFYRVLKLVGIPLFFILYADFSTFVIICTALFIMVIAAKTPILTYLKTAGVGILLLSVLVLFSDYLPKKIGGRFTTIKSRILAFDKDIEVDTSKPLTPEELKDYELTQADYSSIAVLRSKPLGGLDKSTVSNYLAAAHTDFIYAIIIETYGWSVAILISCLYILFLVRCIKIAYRSENNFGALIVLGLATIYSIQSVVNMGVSVGLFPVTGQPMPFLSMGGSSAVFTAIGFGMINSISNQSTIARERRKKENIDKIIIEEADRVDRTFSKISGDIEEESEDVI